MSASTPGLPGYLSLTDADRDAMLDAIGVESVDELFEQIPEGVRLGRALEVPEALPEAALVRHLEQLAGRNADTSSELSFLGMGIYDHYVPAIVDAFLSRGELLTAYTPYQPEMSQGVLQAIFEYQTAICELTGMDVSNASGYDGTTVAADACFIARAHTGRTRIVLAETLHPMVRQVVKTYAPGFGMEVVEVAHDGGTIDPARFGEAADGAAIAIFQQPNTFGCLEPAPDLAAAAADGVARFRSPTSTSPPWGCSRRRATTAARWRSARASRSGTTSPTVARTMASWRRARSSSGGCRAASSARRPTSRGSAASSSRSRRASSTSVARRRRRT